MERMQLLIMLLERKLIAGGICRVSAKERKPASGFPSGWRERGNGGGVTDCCQNVLEGNEGSMSFFFFLRSLSVCCLSFCATV